VFSGDGMKVLPDRSDYFIMATFSLNLPLSVVMTRMYIPFDALLRSIVVAPFIPVPYCRDLTRAPAALYTSICLISEGCGPAVWLLACASDTSTRPVDGLGEMANADPARPDSGVRADKVESRMASGVVLVRIGHWLTDPSVAMNRFALGCRVLTFFERVLFFSMQGDITVEGVNFCKQLIFNA
jgi:hypothetical protein